ncbi:hypothetical protein JST97_03030 [bacterium]|nr:hypothetical protein [bacterium]
MRNITTGGLILLYGFLNGGSIFLGNPSPVDWAFDSAGIGLVLFGAWKVYQQRP